jgi:hypothetical protein
VQRLTCCFSQTGSYPSNLNFLSSKRPEFAPLNDPYKGSISNEAAVSYGWLLTPAIVGAGATFLLLLMSKGNKKCQEKEQTKKRMPGLIIYTGIATAGVALYIYNVLTNAKGHLMDAYLPVSGAIMVQILYYAAIYSLINRLDPRSFSPEIDGSITDELLTFVYFSISTFATAGGDIGPVTSTAKMLVSLQILFFIFIFTMGLVFFVSP